MVGRGDRSGSRRRRLACLFARSQRGRMGQSQGGYSRRRLDQRRRLGQSRRGMDQWRRRRWRLDKPPRRWRWRLGQSLVGKFTGIDRVSQEVDNPLIFLRADSEERPGDRPFVVIVRSREELSRWLHDRSSALQWIQVEGLLSDADAWASAAQGAGDIPLDVVLSAPGSEFADLYRLVDVLAVRDVRVSMPATPRFFKAVRLAASLGLPVRLLPGQPSTKAVEELAAGFGPFIFMIPWWRRRLSFFILRWLGCAARRLVRCGSSPRRIRQFFGTTTPMVSRDYPARLGH